MKDLVNQSSEVIQINDWSWSIDHQTDFK